LPLASEIAQKSAEISEGVGWDSPMDVHNESPALTDTTDTPPEVTASAEEPSVPEKRA
jgi:hypothetical protein